MEQIQDMYQRLVAQRSHLEDRVQQLRTLFKPWPPPQVEKKTSAENSSNNDLKEKSPEPDSSKPTLTAEEEEGVVLVDKLLQKAQKARNIQKKLEEPKRPRDVKGPKSNVQCINSTEEQRTDQKVISETNPTPKNETVSTTNKQTSNRKNGMIEKDHKNSQTIPKMQTNQAKSGQEKKSSNLSTAKPSVRQHSGTSHQQSSAPRQASGQSRRKPVHSSAPFQTDPRLNPGKLQTTYRASTAKTMAKARAESAKARSKHPAKNITPSANRDSPVESVNSNPTKRSSNQSGRVIKNENRTESESERTNSSYEEHCDRNNSGKSTNRQDCDNSADVLSKRVENLDLKQKEDGATAAKQDHAENKGFQLLVDGSSLTLPTVYRKHVYQNRKLREKVCTQNVTKKVDAPSASQDFANHLKQTFHDISTEEAHIQGIQAQHMVGVYDSLYDLLKNLNLDSISEEQNAAVIMRARKLLEYILVKFQETEQLLHSSDFRMLSSVRGCDSKTVQKIIKPENQSISVWYNQKHPLPGFDGVSQYKYRTFKQLETYITLVYNIQWYQLQLDLMDTTAQLILPVLQSLDPTSSDYIHVLRAGYSLLSTNPNKGPVVVQDTIHDTSMLETEETNS